MRTAAAFVLVYVLFLLQSAINEAAPDLAYVTVIVVALHETRLVAVLLAGFLGVCFDSLSFSQAGLHTAAFALVGYFAGAARRYIYRVAWATPLLVVLALVIRWILRLTASPNPPDPFPTSISVALTLAFIPLADWFVAQVLFPKWNQD